MKIYLSSLFALFAVLLASAEVKWTQNERGDWEYDESDPELMKAAERLGLLSSALQDVENHERIADWLSEARSSGADVYLDELGAMLYDAVAIMMMASYNAQRLFGLGSESESEGESYVLLKENTREELSALGFPAPKHQLRYVANSSDADGIDENIDEFAALFRAHVTQLMAKVEAGDVIDVGDHLLADIVQLRQWLEKRWARVPAKETQRLAVDEEKVHSGEKPRVHEFLRDACTATGIFVSRFA